MHEDKNYRILNLLMPKTSPSCKNRFEFLPYPGQNDILVLCVQCSEATHHAFTEAAAQQIYAAFVLVRDAEVARQVRDATSTEAEVVLLRNFDEAVQGFSDAPERLDLWLQQRSVPLIAPFSPQVSEVIVKPGIPIVVESLRPVAREFLGRLKWTYLDLAENLAGAKRMGTPLCITVDDMSKYGVHYVFPEDQPVAPAAVVSFLMQVLSGSIKPTIVSEPVPDSSDLALPVVTVVGQNFETVAQKAEVNTFVMVMSLLKRQFYADWCPHCKALSPTWESLGAHYAGDPLVRIGKANMMLNDFPWYDSLIHRQLGITNFPTLYLFPASGAKPVEFLAKERPLEQLIEFVEKHRNLPKKADL